MNDKVVEEILDQYAQEQRVCSEFTKAIDRHVQDLLVRHPEPSHIALVAARTKSIDSLRVKLGNEPGKYKALTDITDLSA